MGNSKSSERSTRRNIVERAIDSFVIGVDVDVAVATEEMEEVSEGTGSGVEVERACN